MWSLVGALIFTYWASRAALRWLPSSLGGWPRVLLSHGISLAVVAMLIGICNAYFTSFALDRALVAVLPQMLWLVFDVVQERNHPA